MAEWSIAAVLKTVDLHGSGGSNPSLSALSTLATPPESTTKDSNPEEMLCGNSSVGRASASQAEGREFEPRFPL